MSHFENVRVWIIYFLKSPIYVFIVVYINKKHISFHVYTQVAIDSSVVMSVHGIYILTQAFM